MFDDLYNCTTQKELRAKYREYSKKYHPDSYSQLPDEQKEAEENMKLLNSIYEECCIRIRDAKEMNNLSDIDIVEFCRAAGIKIVKEKQKPKRDPRNYRGWWYSPDKSIGDIVDILRESVRDIDDYDIEITNPYNRDTILVRVLGGRTNEGMDYGVLPSDVRNLMSYKQLSFRLRNILKDIIMSAKDYNYYYEGEVHFNLKLQIGKTEKTVYKYKKAKVKKSRIYHDREFYARELVSSSLPFYKVPPRFRDANMLELALLVSTFNLECALDPKLKVVELLDEEMLSNVIRKYPFRVKEIISILESSKAKLPFNMEEVILNLWRVAVSEKFSLCKDAPEVIKEEENYYAIKEKQDKRSIIELVVTILENKSEKSVRDSVIKLSKLLMMYDVELTEIVPALALTIKDKELFRNIPKPSKKTEINISKFFSTLLTATIHVQCNITFPNHKWNHEKGVWEIIKK